LLDDRCNEIFTEYIDREYGGSPLAIEETLSVAFEQGTYAAKHRGDASSCPYSAVSDPEPFLAWVEGFECCSVHRGKQGRRIDLRAGATDSAPYLASSDGGSRPGGQTRTLLDRRLDRPA
jgi:hypothetical protein